MAAPSLRRYAASSAPEARHTALLPAEIRSLERARVNVVHAWHSTRVVGGGPVGQRLLPRPFPRPLPRPLPLPLLFPPLLLVFGGFGGRPLDW